MKDRRSPNEYFKPSSPPSKEPKLTKKEIKEAVKSALDNPTPWKDQLSKIRAEAGSKGGKRRIAYLREVGWNRGEAGGRPPVPTMCPRCNTLLESFTQANRHCRRPYKKHRLTPENAAIARKVLPENHHIGRPFVPLFCEGCHIKFPSSRMWRSHKCLLNFGRKRPRKIQKF